MTPVRAFLRHLGLVLVLAVSALTCDGSGPTLIPGYHPIVGDFPKLITNVAYDVDTSRSFDVTYTKTLIQGAQALADANNPLYDDPMAMDPEETPQSWLITRYEKFHYWPNILNLTEIYYQDSDLYDLIRDEILALEPEAADLATAIDSAVVAGERVFLARDFINQVQYGAYTFNEVHYAFLLNLDSREITEISVHRYGSDDLGIVHDPHTDRLKAEFAVTLVRPEGQRWELCLRGNHRRTKYNSIIVDYLGQGNAANYWVRRTNQACVGSQDRPEQLFPEFLPLQPPNMPPPMMPPEDEFPPPPSNPNPPMQPSTPSSPVTPVSPWPFPGPEVGYDPPEAEDDGGSMETPSIPVPPCSPTEEGAIPGKIADLEAMLMAARAARNADRETLAPFEWEWVDDAMFNSDCIQDLYDELDMQVQELKQQRQALVDEYQMLAEQKEMLRENASLAVQMMLYRESIWDNMLHVNGPWSRESVPCMPPWIPAGGNPFEDPTGGSVIIITVEQQAQFQRSIAFGLMNGKTWAQAVQAALNDPRNYPDDVVYKDLVYQLIWKQYSDCMKKLYTKMLQNYLRASFEPPTLSSADLDAMIAVMFDGAGGLSSADRAEWEELQRQLKQRCDRLKEIRQELEDIDDQIDALRRQFRSEAIKCLNNALSGIEDLKQQLWILQAFQNWCADPDAADSLPLVIPGKFCPALMDMKGNPAYEACGSFLQYLDMLIAANC